MDAITNSVPLPLEEEEEVSTLLPERNECRMQDVHLTGRVLGLSCQQIFERAYLRIQHPQSFARAVFARYMASLERKPPLPAPVAAFCQEMADKGGKRASAEGFCAACMLNEGGRSGLIEAYFLIHPESLEQDVLGKSGETEEIPLIEKLYLNLLDSGALDTNDEEDWKNVADSEEDT